MVTNISKLVKLFYPDKIKQLVKYRWLLTIGILFMGLISKGQRNNVWPLNSSNSFNPNTDFNYCLDFNYCPSVYHSFNIEHDKYLRYIHTKYSGEFYRDFTNSFCDTGGQFVFTEVLGQHYYNKSGLIYDSTYMQSSPNGYGNAILGASVSSNNKTYYLRPFNIMYFDSKVPKWGNGWITSDSIVICVSEFDNNGVLLKKNMPIYKLSNGQPLLPGSKGTKIDAFMAKMIDEDLVEIFITCKYGNLNFLLHYNTKTGKIIKQESLSMDTISRMKYST